MPVLRAFRDYHVHRVLETPASRKAAKKLYKCEWFKVDIKTAIKAIEL